MSNSNKADSLNVKIDLCVHIGKIEFLSQLIKSITNIKLHTTEYKISQPLAIFQLFDQSKFIFAGKIYCTFAMEWLCKMPHFFVNCQIIIFYYQYICVYICIQPIHKQLPTSPFCCLKEVQLTNSTGFTIPYRG